MFKGTANLTVLRAAFLHPVRPGEPDRPIPPWRQELLRHRRGQPRKGDRRDDHPDLLRDPRGRHGATRAGASDRDREWLGERRGHGRRYLTVCTGPGTLHPRVPRAVVALAHTSRGRGELGPVRGLAGRRQRLARCSTTPSRPFRALRGITLDVPTARRYRRLQERWFLRASPRKWDRLPC